MAAAGRDGGTSRYVDREHERSPERRAPSQAWHHPQAHRGAPEPPPDPSGRFVDHSFFDDHAHDVTDMPLRRGARVKHDRFGEGEVMVVTSTGEPAVVAFFPGWGEKKILARFLKPAG
jgi:DNA helicase-2/ATP-dependent DNA helicase PcrA